MSRQQFSLPCHPGGSAHAWPKVAYPLQPFVGALAVNGYLMQFHLSRSRRILCACHEEWVNEADNAFSVFVYDGETATVSKRAVKTGGLGENNVAILEGLAEDDIIATAGVSFLEDGQRVTLLDEELVRNAP